VAATDLQAEHLPWLLLDAELVFESQTKTLLVEPRLELGDFACIEVYGDLVLGSPTQFDGFRFTAIEVTCELGPVTVREVSLFAPCHVALTTEAYGSQLVYIDDALANGWEDYPDYWEMLSISFVGDACCEGEFSFLLNVYFDEDSTSLFDWAMTSVRAHLPLGEQLSFTLGFKATEAGAEYVAFGFDLSW
jgi:hypothetical protein